MLSAVKVPALFTHYLRMTDEASGILLDATSDHRAPRVRALVAGTGQRLDDVSLPTMGHSCPRSGPPGVLRHALVVDRLALDLSRSRVEAAADQSSERRPPITIRT